MIQGIPVTGVPEIRQGSDLGALLVKAATAADGPGLANGDVLVVASKVVGKAEGRIARGRSRDEVIDSETVRVVSEWNGPGGRTIIAETRHGLVLAAAGVDVSNTEPGTLVLLPVDPDASAARLRAHIHETTGANVAVVVSDTMGRPWRVGQTDAAIGAAGLIVLDDLRGTPDGNGTRLAATVRGVADEIAGAAELVAGKARAIPAVVVRGLAPLVLPPGSNGTGAAALVRAATEDRFRLGTPEAMRAAVLGRRSVREFSDVQVPREAILRAIEAAATAPAPHHTTPWRFVLVETPQGRTALLDAMREQWVSDLRGDGFTEGQIARRLRRGDVLRRTPALVVPCLVRDGMHHYPDKRRATAERSVFVLSMGAAIENLLVALAADGLGSAWIGSTLFCPEVVQRCLSLPDDHHPMGAVAIGVPARAPAPHMFRDVDHLVLSR